MSPDAPNDWKAWVLAVGLKVRRERLKLGLSQSKLARKADVADTTVSRLERGERMPQAEHLEQIADALEMELKALLAVSQRAIDKAATNILLPLDASEQELSRSHRELAAV
jgi:transcriptional regulator with XRE-family HTH domain